MFHLDRRAVYRAGPLAQIPWLEHGFGTRSSSDWPDQHSLATLRQIHSNNVLLAENPGCAGEGDALISNRPGVTLSIRTADCLPILIADVRNRAVAAVHAGWRGVVNGVVPRTVESMHRHFGSRPEDLVIAVGPGIGACCFEIGPEVAMLFEPLFPDRTDLKAKTRIDLAETVRRQLGRNGGVARQIADSRLCTVCLPNRFYSYRRDGEAAGRMISAIRIL